MARDLRIIEKLASGFQYQIGHRRLFVWVINFLTSNIQAKYLTGMPKDYKHQPGWQYICWNPGHYLPDLEQVKEHLRCHFSFVGITERFHDGLIPMAKALGWLSPVTAYYGNRSEQRPARDSIDSNTLGLLMEKNTIDFELYDYTSQLIQKR